MDKTPLILQEFTASTTPGVETYSPFCLKVRRALTRAGLPYQARYASSPGEVKRVNPACQVPVLIADGQPICDSTRIVAFIEDRAEAPMQSALSARQQAEALLWEELADTAVNGFVVASRRADDDNWPHCREAFFRSAPRPLRALIAPRVRKRVVNALVARDFWRTGPRACWQRFELLLDQLERRAPEQDYWLGEHLSVADSSLFAQVQSLRCELTPRQAASVEKRAVLCRFLDRVDVATRRVAEASQLAGAVAAQ